MTNQDEFKQTRKSFISRHPYISTVGGVVLGALLFKGCVGEDKNYLKSLVQPQAGYELVQTEFGKVAKTASEALGIAKTNFDLYTGNQKRDDSQDTLIADLRVNDEAQNAQIRDLEKQLLAAQKVKATKKAPVSTSRSEYNERPFSDNDGTDDGLYTNRGDIERLIGSSHRVDKVGTFDLDMFGDGVVRTYEFRELNVIPKGHKGTRGIFYNKEVGAIDAFAACRYLADSVDGDDGNTWVAGPLRVETLALAVANKYGHAKLGTAEDRDNFEGFIETFIQKYKPSN